MDETDEMDAGVVCDLRLLKGIVNNEEHGETLWKIHNECAVATPKVKMENLLSVIR